MKIVLLGHVDHGKSTLGGNLIFNSNTINKRDIDKIKKQADQLKMSRRWLAHILDEDDNERLKGKTYSFNIVQFEYQGNIFEIIDVPGHKELVNEMIYGTSRADLAVLVISIRKGEYEAGLLGQSLEHIMIARGMGLKSLVIALNKMDTINWDFDEYNRVVTDLTRKIKRFRFKHIIFVPISAFRGDNVIKRYNNTLVKYSLIEAINTIIIIPRKTKLIKPNDNKINGRFLFYHIENLITTGYVCKLHTNIKLYDVEFVKIHNSKLPFVTQNNSKGKLINVVLKLNTKDAINTNVILRDGNKTIAIGILEYDE